MSQYGSAIIALFAIGRIMLAFPATALVQSFFSVKLEHP